MNVELNYDGQVYRIIGRSVSEVQAEIDGIVISGLPGWIEAYDGHGARTPMLLLITNGVHITLAPMGSGDDPEF